MEEKMEKILKTILIVQTTMNTKGNNDDINSAIAQIRREIGTNSDKIISNSITELIENFAKSSETLLKDIKDMKSQIEKLQAIVDSDRVQLINALSIKPPINNIEKEELKQSEIDAAQKE